MKVSNHTTALKLVKELYGDSKRKGIDKLSVDHVRDVVEYCFLHLERDNLRVMRLLNVALLHDVVEDYSQAGYTLERVQDLVGLGPQETVLLDLVTRKKGQEESYLPSIFANEEAARVKIADRIANCRDLIAWVKKEQGFAPAAELIYQKYRRENAIILALLEQNYPVQLNDGDHPLTHQVRELKGAMNELEELRQQYLN